MCPPWISIPRVQRGTQGPSSLTASRIRGPVGRADADRAAWTSLETLRQSHSESPSHCRDRVGHMPLRSDWRRRRVDNVREEQPPLARAARWLAATAISALRQANGGRAKLAYRLSARSARSG